MPKTAICNAKSQKNSGRNVQKTEERKLRGRTLTSSAIIPKTVFWDVDTQRDFMKSDGALYVPESEEIGSRVGGITETAKDGGYIVMGSVDYHTEDDEELERNGGPFPDHCMKNSGGEEKIEEVAKNLDNPIYIPSSEMSEEEINEITEEIKRGREAYFQKHELDVFSNGNVEKVLDGIDIERVMMYGVTTEYCVKEAALGMRDRGLDVYVLEDATKPVSKEDGREAIEEMKEEGVEMINCEDYRGLLEVDI
ncbi:MAG: cysteine hydrolase family protein [Candidatus Aenigmatarchaeota archaeon]